MSLTQLLPELWTEVFSHILPPRHPLSYGIPVEAKQTLIQLCLTSRQLLNIATPYLYAHIQIPHTCAKFLTQRLESTLLPRPNVISLAITRAGSTYLDDPEDIKALLLCLGNTQSGCLPLRRLYVQDACLYSVLHFNEIMTMLPHLTDVGCVRALYCKESPIHGTVERVIIYSPYAHLNLAIRKFFQLPRIKSVCSVHGFSYDGLHEFRLVKPKMDPSKRFSFIYGWTSEKQITGWDPSELVLAEEDFEGNVFPVVIDHLELATPKCLDGSVWDYGILKETTK